MSTSAAKAEKSAGNAGANGAAETKKEAAPAPAAAATAASQEKKPPAIPPPPDAHPQGAPQAVRGRPTKAVLAQRKLLEERPWLAPEILQEGREIAGDIVIFTHPKLVLFGRHGFDKSTAQDFVTGTYKFCAKYMAGGHMPPELAAILTLLVTVPTVFAAQPNSAQALADNTLTDEQRKKMSEWKPPSISLVREWVHEITHIIEDRKK